MAKRANKKAGHMPAKYCSSDEDSIRWEATGREAGGTGRQQDQPEQKEDTMQLCGMHLDTQTRPGDGRGMNIKAIQAIEPLPSFLSYSISKRTLK
jgi:hypothetical protein